MEIVAMTYSSDASRQYRHTSSAPQGAAHTAGVGVPKQIYSAACPSTEGRFAAPMVTATPIRR